MNRILMLGYANAIAQERVMQWAVELGYDVVAVTPSGKLPKFLGRSPHFQIVTFPPDWLTSTIKNDQENKSEALRQLVKHLCQEFEISIVHAHGLHSGVEIVASMDKDVQTVVSVWGALSSKLYTSVPHYLDEYFTDHYFEALARVDGVIVETPAQKVLLDELLGNKVTIAEIPMGPDTELFRPSPYSQKEAFIARHRVGIPPDAFVFFSARAWATYYQHEQVIEAFARGIDKMHGNPWLMFGALGRGDSLQDVRAYWMKVRTLAETLGVDDRIAWAAKAPYDEMPTLYAMADVIVNVPMVDALPATLLEAMACERLVISSDLVTYHQTPLYKHLRLVPPNDIDALADAMVAATKLTEIERRTLVNGARRMIIDDYDDKQCAMLLKVFYDKLHRS